MDDIHSQNELKYRKRWAADGIKSALKTHPVVVLTGARQVGKSTLLVNEFSLDEWKYLNFDDFNILAQAQENPASLWTGTHSIIIDEVQKAENVLAAVKLAVDSYPGKFRFILSGSSNLLLMKNVSESLAGRAVYFILNPMTQRELKQAHLLNSVGNFLNGILPQERKVKNTVKNTHFMMWKGFMPALMKMEHEQEITRWWDGYVTTYLERDLRQLSQIESLPMFRKLMNTLALRCGQILNQTSLSRETGISQPTVYRYINLLETTCILERIPAYYVNRTKRLMKSPKIIWLDPGLVSFLSGHYSAESLIGSRESGSVFESMVYLHLKTLCELIIPKPHILYWRTTTGKEVDFVIEWGKKLLAFEVKYSNRVNYPDIKNLQLFMSEYPETTAGVVIYNGNEIKRMDEKICALPWYYL